MLSLRQSLDILGSGAENQTWQQCLWYRSPHLIVRALVAAVLSRAGYVEHDPALRFAGGAARLPVGIVQSERVEEAAAVAAAKGRELVAWQHLQQAEGPTSQT